MKFHLKYKKRHKVAIFNPWQGTASCRRETTVNRIEIASVFERLTLTQRYKNEMTKNENTNNQNGSLNNE